MSFANQALRGVSSTHQVELLEKYQKVTKEEVIQALSKHFLPLFESSSSIAMVVTAPGRAEHIATELAKDGFEVEQRKLEIDQKELEEGSESEDSEDDDSEHSSS